MDLSLHFCNHLSNQTRNYGGYKSVDSTKRINTKMTTVISDEGNERMTSVLENNEL